ncbi:MAG: DUF1080 domain-containing protein [Bryobacteraceae bacterium]|nr:DUF1080 domain-containing protein [Bryobacteraceae bacterium]
MKRIAACLLLVAAAAFAQTEWQPLFDGKTLKGWNVIEGFRNHGAVKVEDGSIVMTNGEPFTGINYSGKFPTNQYEIRFEAKKGRGGDFFASLTFPFGESFGTFVVGGWGGDIIGISSLDGWDASENETRAYYTFEENKWYSFRLRVTPEKIEAWIDNEQVVNLSVNGRRIELRAGATDLTKPLGFFSYNTSGTVRKIAFRTAPKQ